MAFQSRPDGPVFNVVERAAIWRQDEGNLTAFAFKAAVTE